MPAKTPKAETFYAVTDLSHDSNNYKAGDVVEGRSLAALRRYGDRFVTTVAPSKLSKAEQSPTPNTEEETS